MDYLAQAHLKRLLAKRFLSSGGGFFKPTPVKIMVPALPFFHATDKNSSYSIDFNKNYCHMQLRIRKGSPIAFAHISLRWYYLSSMFSPPRSKSAIRYLRFTSSSIFMAFLESPDKCVLQKRRSLNRQRFLITCNLIPHEASFLKELQKGSLKATGKQPARLSVTRKPEQRSRTK